MAAEKETTMFLKVDLQCPCCYKKIKKILCKFPQIRDQVYDQKENKVTIIVLCCDPENIRDKLCCKGAKVITSIEIKKPDRKPNEPPQNCQTEPKTVLVPDFPPRYPFRTCCGQCYEGYGGGPCYHGYGVPPPPCYDGYRYGGYGRYCHMSRCDYYYSEEYPSSCSIT